MAGPVACPIAGPVAWPIAGSVARPIAGPVARPIAGPIAPPMHPGTLTQRRGDGGLGDRTKSEGRSQKAESRGAGRTPDASQKPEVKAQKAKSVQIRRPGDADFDDGFGVRVRIYMRRL